jgi:hypothetical protein
MKRDRFNKLERDAGEKPVSTFSHPVLERDVGGENDLSFQFRPLGVALVSISRAFSVLIKSEPRLYHFVLTRFLHANRSHFARKRSRLSRDFGLVLGLAANLSLIFPSASVAQEEAGKTKAAPMPPVRPARWPAAPPASAKVTAPVTAPATLGPTMPNDMVSTIYPDQGPMLPTASRTRMHQCGQEWETMKASGAAADQTWRAFAQACLVR